MRNLVESSDYHLLFCEHPPIDFEAALTDGGIPFFKTSFDLLTTVDPPLARKLRRIPLLPRLLRFNTCFIGTTITEYAPLPTRLPAADCMDAVLRAGAGSTLTILKDLPLDSPLVSEDDNRYALELRQNASQKGFICVEGQALAYVPMDFPTIDHYLQRLSPSRRKDIKRKLKKRDQLEIKAIRLGDPFFSSTAVQGELYELYREVFNQSEIHFDRLSAAFFRSLLCGGKHDGTVMLYYHNRVLAGYNILLINNEALIDKYIGLRYPLAREINLYFISWFHNLQYALDNNLKTYIAGWTDPEVKTALGASFTFTCHLVYVRNRLLRATLKPFKRFFESDRRIMERK